MSTESTAARKNVSTAEKGSRRIKKIFGRLARRRRLLILAVGATSFVISATLSFFIGIPKPNVHDEFSYLLAADTFSRGRLTNPTHPMWIHFETFHIIHQPTYASKYPPGQGLALALGQVVFGRPYVGVWLSVALGCAAICWMLMGWVPPRWALLGGMLATIHPTIVTWGQNYWGGAVAMWGGALVIGAFGRLVRQPRTSDGIFLGLGFTVLANSRPYEGILLSAPFVVALLWRAVKERGDVARPLLRRAALPAGLILLLTVGAMTYYNFRVTGNPLHMPYMVHEAKYKVVPPFLWQSKSPEPVYNHKNFHDIYVQWEDTFYKAQRSVSGFAVWAVAKILILIMGFFNLVGLVIPLVALPIVLERSAWMRVALFAGGFFTAALLPVTWLHIHYAAPATGLFFLLVMQSMRQTRQAKWRGLHVGKPLLWVCVVLCLVSFIGWYRSLSPFDGTGPSADRERVIMGLKREGGRHLVIVRYTPEHWPHTDWVYNEADIDGADIVWAREMDAGSNEKLIKYFADRRIWLLEADAVRPEPIPYTPRAGHDSR